MAIVIHNALANKFNLVKIDVYFKLSLPFRWLQIKQCIVIFAAPSVHL